MLHIPAKYQTRNLYGYGNFPPDMSKSGISAFKMAARRPSWIRSTQFFVYRWGLWGYILIPNLACLPYPIMKISHQNYSVYDDGRKVNAIARWSFGPSGLKITSKTVIDKFKAIFARLGILFELITDNGSQFTSREFKRFARGVEL